MATEPPEKKVVQLALETFLVRKAHKDLIKSIEGSLKPDIKYSDCRGILQVFFPNREAIKVKYAASLISVDLATTLNNKKLRLQALRPGWHRIKGRVMSLFVLSIWRFASKNDRQADELRELVDQGYGRDFTDAWLHMPSMIEDVKVIGKHIANLNCNETSAFFYNSYQVQTNYESITAPDFVFPPDSSLWPDLWLRRDDIFKGLFPDKQFAKQMLSCIRGLYESGKPDAAKEILYEINRCKKTVTRGSLWCVAACTHDGVSPTYNLWDLPEDLLVILWCYPGLVVQNIAEGVMQLVFASLTRLCDYRLRTRIDQTRKQIRALILTNLWPFPDTLSKLQIVVPQIKSKSGDIWQRTGQAYRQVLITFIGCVNRYLTSDQWTLSSKRKDLRDGQQIKRRKIEATDQPFLTKMIYFLCPHWWHRAVLVDFEPRIKHLKKAIEIAESIKR